MQKSKPYCRVDVLVAPGTDMSYAARIKSLFPRFVMGVTLSHRRILELDDLLEASEHNTLGVDEVTEMLREREKLVGELVVRAVLTDIVEELAEWRRYIDGILTTLFMTTMLLYLKSPVIGVAVDVLLITGLYFSERVFRYRRECVDQLVNDLFAKKHKGGKDNDAQTLQ